MPHGKWRTRLDTTPTLLVICGNNRRQRQLHQWRNKPFANDHLDAFFNASVDAAILLATLVVAAEAVGLGACPLSQIRNDAARASRILGLPDHVFPVAALALGWPAEAPPITTRLPLALTVHRNRFDDDKTRALRERYLGDNDSAVYLIRPDQHVAARRPSFDDSQFRAALRRAIGKEHSA